jgi:hypothetical protein
MRRRFGSAYEEYARQVPRFIPRFRPRLKRIHNAAENNP